MLSWLLNLFDRPGVSPPPPARAIHPGVRVFFDDKWIRAEIKGRGLQEMRWSSLGGVSIKSLSGQSDLIWMLSTREGRVAITVPMGAAGEAELIRTLQVRLHGFDNMAVIEAMSSPDDAEFQVWPPHDFAAA